MKNNNSIVPLPIVPEKSYPNAAIDKVQILLENNNKSGVYA
jgi:hypothetical protein